MFALKTVLHVKSFRIPDQKLEFFPFHHIKYTLVKFPLIPGPLKFSADSFDILFFELVSYAVERKIVIMIFFSEYIYLNFSQISGSAIRISRI